MGNAVVKDETDLLEGVENSGRKVEENVVSSSDSLRFICGSDPSEIAYPVEDAISVTTDLTTASITEYESANDNDAASNRLSSCTDTSYDLPIDTNYVCDFPNEYQNFAVRSEDCHVPVYVSQVSSECFERVKHVDGDCFSHELSGLVEVVCRTAATGNEFTEDAVEPSNDDEETFFSLSSNYESDDPAEELRTIDDGEVVQRDTSFHGQSRSVNLRQLKRENPLLKMRTKQRKLALRSVSKSNFKTLPIVYKNFLVSNYEHVFKNKPKSNSVFDTAGSGLCKAKDTRETSPWLEQRTVVKLHSRKVTEILNSRARYSPFFEFNSENVFLSQDNCMSRLDVTLVREFFANQYLYLDLLNDVKFSLGSCEQRLWFTVHPLKERLRILFRMTEVADKPSSSQIPCKEKRKVDSLLCSTSKNSHVAIVTPYQVRSDTKGMPTESVKWTSESSVWKSIDKYEGKTAVLIDSSIIDVKKNVADSLSVGNENPSAYPSLDCIDEQLISINSDTMNCNENVSEAGPTTASNMDNLNNIPLLNDSSDLEYISRMGGTGLVAENLRKQSLYVKFDPLVADESNTTINGDVTLSINDLANLSLNEHEHTITSNLEVTDFKANENEPVGKLISVTPNKSPRKTPTPKSSPRFPENDPEDLSELKSLLLKQMKREEAFKEEIDLVRREHEQTLLKLQNVEKDMSQLRNTLEASQEEAKKLKNELRERIKNKQQLSIVMEEYEKTISQMVTKREDEKKEFEASIAKIEAERDSTVQHLNNLENAFNDVHQKYERGKVVNEALKKNEDILKKSLAEYEVTVKTVENKYELLKSHATSQLEKANQELELITQTYEKEQAKLKAMLRKSEIQINSLQNALDQKTKENQELTAVCDELIVKLSSHSNT